MNQELHDRLHKQLSDEGLAHDGLPIEATADEILVEENMATFTEDEVKALVEKAVGDATGELQAKLEEVEAAKKELETKDVEITIASLNETVKEIQAKLDTAILEAEAAKNEKAELTAYLEAEKAAADKEAEIAELSKVRVAKVAEVASFPQEYLEANTDRWARMSEEDFDASVADYAAVAAKKDTSGNEMIPEHTSLKASKESEKKNGSIPRHAVFELRKLGVDAREAL
jgi:hypothetical protein